jgi:hypothetical protein
MMLTAQYLVSSSSGMAHLPWGLLLLLLSYSQYWRMV